MGIKVIQKIVRGALSADKDARAKARRFRQVLLRWAGSHGRSFPWRGTADPYRTIVAEIMLQRTRSEQVVPVYRRFIEEYPDIRALANAHLAGLRRILRPLGLAFRARTFPALARAVIEQHAARVPLKAEEAIALPGVGPYVASAIDAFLTGRHLPVIDANVARVLARVFGLGGGDWRSATAGERRAIHEIAALCLGRAAPRAYHYALLDFAARLCSPVRPACPECPVHKAGICSYCAEARSAGPSPQ